MNYCPKCGFKLTGDVNFCPKCGFDVRKTQNISEKVSEPVAEMPVEEKTKFSPKMNNALRHRMVAFYNVLSLMFDFKETTGNLQTRFYQLLENIKPKITYAEYNELNNRVVPYLDKGHYATKDEVEYVVGLMDEYVGKYRKPIVTPKTTVSVEKHDEIEPKSVKPVETSSVNNNGSIQNADSTEKPSFAKSAPESNQIENNDLTNNLSNKLSFLSGQSSNAIADAEKLNSVQEYMHVSRTELEKDFLEEIEALNNQHGKIIFLVGNVGDGKSHLIGYLKEHNPELFKEKNIKIHYDATESFDPKMTAMDTLVKTITPYDDNHLSDTRENLIIAINMGVLINLKSRIQSEGNFTKVIDFIDQTKIVESTSKLEPVKNENFALISFRNYPLFKIDETGVNSSFYDELLKKVIDSTRENPFYSAYQADKFKSKMNIVDKNFELLSDTNVRETLKFLLIKIQVENKIVISTRALLELIHDILVPYDTRRKAGFSYHDSLPFLLFDGGDSMLLKKIAAYDPIKKQNDAMDKLTTRIYNSTRPVAQLADELMESTKIDKYNWIFDFTDNNIDEDFVAEIKIIVRFKYLLERRSKLFPEDNYYQYLTLMQILRDTPANEVRRTSQIREFYKQVKQFIFSWCGSPKTNYVFVFFNQEKKFGIAVPFDLKFNGAHENDFNIVMELQNSDANQSYSMPIDFDLFNLIINVGNHYLLKDEDKHKFVNIATFIEKITKSNKAKEETIACYIEPKKYYRLMDDGIGIEIEETSVK